MSIHNICFYREIRKILCGYPHLSVAMLIVSFWANVIRYIFSCCNPFSMILPAPLKFKNLIRFASCMLNLNI